MGKKFNALRTGEGQVPVLINSTITTAWVYGDWVEIAETEIIVVEYEHTPGDEDDIQLAFTVADDVGHVAETTANAHLTREDPYYGTIVDDIKELAILTTKGSRTFVMNTPPWNFMRVGVRTTTLAGVFGSITIQLRGIDIPR